MSYNPEIHHRRSIRLKGYDYSQAGLYFVTICVQKGTNAIRPHIFGDVIDGKMILSNIGKIIDNEWCNLKNKYPHIELHEYIIMPNHFHAIIEISTASVRAGFAHPNISEFPESSRQANPAPTATTTTTATLGNIIGYFKYQTTKLADLPHKLWQRNYYEHIIRDRNAHARIAEYIENNPMKWEMDCFYKE